MNIMLIIYYIHKKILTNSVLYVTIYINILNIYDL